MNKKIFLKKAFLSALLGMEVFFALWLTSCSFSEGIVSDEEDVKVTLPSFAADESGKLVAVEFWTLSYTDGIHSGELYNLSSGEGVLVTVSKNKAVAFLAEAVLPLKDEGGPFVHQAGAIFPFNRALSPQNGFASSVLFSLYRGSATSEKKEVQDFLSSFNWQKFEEVCLEKTDNPWLLDKERIMKAISSGKFKKSDVQLSK